MNTTQVMIKLRALLAKLFPSTPPRKVSAVNADLKLLATEVQSIISKRNERIQALDDRIDRLLDVRCAQLTEEADARLTLLRINSIL